MVQALKLWLAENISWLGFVVMTVLGSVVAHIKAYEAAAVEWALHVHFWGIVRRIIYGTLAGLMVYNLHIEFQWSQPLSFVGTGIATIFASDFFDFLWITAKEWVRKKLGLSPEKGEKHGHES